MTTTYTKDELKALEKAMEPFRINKTLRDGVKVSFIDTDAYLVSQRIFAPN